MFIKVILVNANQSSFIPTCPEKQPKSKLVERERQNFKRKEHYFGYKTNHSSATLNKLLVLQCLSHKAKRHQFPSPSTGGDPLAKMIL